MSPINKKQKTKKRLLEDIVGEKYIEKGHEDDCCGDVILAVVPVAIGS